MTRSDVNIERLKEWVSMHGNGETDLLPRTNDDNTKWKRLAIWRYSLIWRIENGDAVGSIVETVKAIHPTFLKVQPNKRHANNLYELVDLIADFVVLHDDYPREFRDREPNEHYLAIRKSHLRKLYAKGKMDNALKDHIEKSGLSKEILVKRDIVPGDQRLSELEHFVERNRRRPNVHNRDDESEAKLAQWVNNQLKMLRTDGPSKNPAIQRRRERVLEIVEGTKRYES